MRVMKGIDCCHYNILFSVDPLREELSCWKTSNVEVEQDVTMVELLACICTMMYGHCNSLRFTYDRIRYCT